MHARDLLRRSQAELDVIYSAASAGAVPNGDAQGTAIVCPGSILARPLAWLARVFAWQGKVFDARGARLVNRVSPLSLRAIDAQLRTEPSWLDGKPCVVIDYSQSSWRIARRIRDEIREVEPGLYLGKVWWGRKRLIDFAVAVRYEPPSPLLRRATAIVATALLALAAYLVWRLRRDEPVGYRDPVEHFKYGSTGGERESGIPLSIWTLLPELFPEHLPERNRDFGFVYEPGRELPIGVSQRNVQGIERVFFNCAICHVGTYRLEADAERVIVPGMPSNTVDLQAFERFLFDCAADEGFTPERIVLALEQRGSEDWLNRKLLRYLGVSLMRERLLLIRDRFAFMDQQPHYGPGRVDTFNPPKVLLNFPMEKLSARERIGTCDLPSIWLQLPREGLQLHWDGNNSSVEERNRSAAFGTGAMPATLDREGMERLADWLRTDREHVPPQLSKERVNAPPLYPQERIDPTRSAAGKPLYERHCAECHGRSGTDFRHDKVGEVTKIGDVGTDPWRLDSYTYDLCVNQNLLYAGYPDERFRHFTKTNGYANQPLDGIWLRAPYLHNGSVPTLLDLLAPPDERPKVFYRGYDVIDHERVGFVSDRGRVEAASRREGREYFLFETEFDGNGNRGHEYGTRLTLEEKRAIVEYLKTF